MNSNASTGDFIHAMENASGKHLQAFFDQWLNHGENPTIKGGWTFDPVKKQITVSLAQVQKGNYLFDIPVEIGIFDNGNPVSKVSKFRMSSKNTQFILPAEMKPEKVVFDPRTVLLAEVDFTENK